MRQYDVLLLDADNTLFDYDRAEAYALRTAFAEASLDCPPVAYDAYREINDNLWRDFETGAVTQSELRALRFSRLFERLDIETDATRFSDVYLKALGRASFLVEGAQKLCQMMVYRRKSLFLVTNGIAAVQRTRMAASLLKDYISELFISEEIGASKPSREFFKAVFARLPSLDRSRILLVGDSPTADIAGGNNAGIDTAWYNPRRIQNPTDNRPTFQVHKLLDLASLIP